MRLHPSSLAGTGFIVLMVVLFTVALRLIRWPEKFSGATPAGAGSPGGAGEPGSGGLGDGGAVAVEVAAASQQQQQQQQRHTGATLIFKDLTYKVPVAHPARG